MKPSAYPPTMNDAVAIERYIILADRSHFRVYQESAPPGQQTSTIRLVTAVDFPSGHADYTDRDSDKAGRFPRSKVTPGGGSIDERLPMQHERDARITIDIAMRIESFLSTHPHVPWVFAGGPDVHRPILQHLHTRLMQRLQSSLQKDLTNFPPAELREHFPSML